MYQQKYIKYKSKYLQLQEGGGIKLIKDGQSKYLFHDLEQSKGSKIIKKYGLDKIEVSSKKSVGKDKKITWLFIAKKYPDLIFKFTLRRSKKDKHVKKASLSYRNRPSSITFDVIKKTTDPSKQFSANLTDDSSSESSDYDNSSSSSSSSEFYTPRTTVYIQQEPSYNILPPVSYNYYKIIYHEFSPSDLARAGIDRFGITIYKYSEKQITIVGSAQRSVYVFTSTTYPHFLFLMSTDTYPDGMTKESLVYRNIPVHLEYYGNYIVTGDPYTLFYGDLIGREA